MTFKGRKEFRQRLNNIVDYLADKDRYWVEEDDYEHTVNNICALVQEVLDQYGGDSTVLQQYLEPEPNSEEVTE